MTYLLIRGMLYFILYQSVSLIMQSFIIDTLSLFQYLFCLLLALKLSAFDKFLSDSSWGKKGNIVLVQCCEKRYANLCVTSSDNWYLYVRSFVFPYQISLNFSWSCLFYLFLFYSGSRPGKYFIIDDCIYLHIF